MPKINNPQNFKGENLISLEEITAKSSEVAPGKIVASLLPTIAGYKEEGTEKLPTTASMQAPTINFIGDCTLIHEADGSITLRVGPNLNHSNLGTNDGITPNSGVLSLTASSPQGTSGKLADGTNVTAIPSGTLYDYTINTKVTNAIMHFDTAADSSFQLFTTIGGVEKVYEFGPVNMIASTNDEGVVTLLPSAAFTAKLIKENNVEIASPEAVQDIKLTVSDFGVEPTAGATGYKGAIKFTIDPKALTENTTGVININSIKYFKSASDTTGKSLTVNADVRYFYTDTTTKPEITASSVTVTSKGSKIVSGVRYLTGATANYSVSFTNIATPVCIADNVSFDANNWAADAKNLDAAYNKTSITGSGAVANGQWAQATNTVKVTVKNINGSVSDTATLANYSLLVDSNNTSDTALIAYFDKEDSASYPRLNSDLTDFDNTKSILETSDLMLKNGSLIYPTGNYVGYNTILGTDFTQPNYTSTELKTGARTWYRKFYEAGDKNGATLTFEASSAISTSAFGSTLTVRIGKLDDEGKVAGWYDATKKGTEAPDGISTNVASNSLTVDWGAYGAAKYGIIVELGMSSSSHEIKKLTVAFA